MVSPIRLVVSPANPTTIDYNWAKAELFLAARVDLTVRARSIPATELSGRGRKLLATQHCEFGSGELVHAKPVGPGAYLKANWEFR